MDKFIIVQPTPEEVKATRIDLGLTQTEAANLVYVDIKTWQRWETNATSGRKIPLAAWELFLIKSKRS